MKNDHYFKDFVELIIPHERSYKNWKNFVTSIPSLIILRVKPTNGFKIMFSKKHTLVFPLLPVYLTSSWKHKICKHSEQYIINDY